MTGQWKKIHFALDLKTKQILAVKLTESNVTDCEVFEEICENIEAKIKTIRADGAYDKYKIYETAEKLGAQTIIPPIKPAKAQNELKNKVKNKTYLRQRDENINFIRGFESLDEGLKEWKIESGYHQRSLIEACIFRFKGI